MTNPPTPPEGDAAGRPGVVAAYLQPAPIEVEGLREAARDALEVMVDLWINHVSGPHAERLQESYRGLRKALIRPAAPSDWGA